MMLVRGPFISALGQIWCPEHFVCVNSQCGRHLQDIGFVEEKGQLYCEYCFEKFIAPPCNKCNNKIRGVRTLSFFIKNKFWHTFVIHLFKYICIVILL